ncbi:MAG TPA: glucokinase [Roseococcus sp.]|jgi:glucokinase|nr:glucokinase [Roseococcus sp.]
MTHTLIADLGGTNARFALAEGGRHGRIIALRVKEHDGPAPAIRQALHRLGLGGAPTRLVCALAAPIEAGPIRLTNAPWVLDREALGRELGIGQVEFLNDLEATAWSLPALAPEDLRTLHAGKAVPGTPLLVVAPGTGLGMAAMAGGQALATEAGHSAFAPGDALEDALLAHLRGTHGPVSNEDLLSGSGLPRLYAALAEMRGGQRSPKNAATIADAARGGDILAQEAVGVFWRALGGFCGDAALLLGARGGVYLAGGAAQKLFDLLPVEAFLNRFRDKPKMQAYLSRIPVHVIIHDQPALMGLARYVARDTGTGP